MSKLTTKQQAFINEYLTDFNATQAAIRAGYSEKTARAIGSENLTKPDISEAIQARLSEKTMSADEVLLRLSQIARNEVTQHITNYGAIMAVDMEAIRKAGLMHLVTEVSNTQSGPKIKFADSQRALETLARVHSLLVDRQEVKVEDWRSQAIEDIKAGHIRYVDLAESFDPDLATQLFQQAGVPVEVGK